MERFICKAKLSKDCVGYEDVPTKFKLKLIKMCFHCRKVHNKNYQKKYHKDNGHKYR